MLLKNGLSVAFLYKSCNSGLSCSILLGILSGIRPIRLIHGGRTTACSMKRKQFTISTNPRDRELQEHRALLYFNERNSSSDIRHSVRQAQKSIAGTVVRE